MNSKKTEIEQAIETSRAHNSIEHIRAEVGIDASSISEIHRRYMAAYLETEASDDNESDWATNGNTLEIWGSDFHIAVDAENNL